MVLQMSQCFSAQEKYHCKIIKLVKANHDYIICNNNIRLLQGILQGRGLQRQNVRVKNPETVDLD